MTIGPALGNDDPFRSGEAAHIHSFEEGGPRFCRMSFEECQSASNGIWLCRICHKEIDLKANEHIFPADILRRWKDQAEERAYNRVGRPLQSAIYDPEKERKRAIEFLAKLGGISDEFFRVDYRSGRQLTSDAIRLISQGSRGFGWGWDRDNPLWSLDDAIWRKQNDVVSAICEINSHVLRRKWSCFAGDEPGCNRFVESRWALLTDADLAYAEQLKNLLARYFQVADEFRNYLRS